MESNNASIKPENTYNSINTKPQKSRKLRCCCGGCFLTFLAIIYGPVIILWIIGLFLDETHPNSPKTTDDAYAYFSYLPGPNKFAMIPNETSRMFYLSDLRAITMGDMFYYESGLSASALLKIIQDKGLKLNDVKSLITISLGHSVAVLIETPKTIQIYNKIHTSKVLNLSNQKVKIENTQFNDSEPFGWAAINSDFILFGQSAAMKKILSILNEETPNMYASDEPLGMALQDFSQYKNGSFNFREVLSDRERSDLYFETVNTIFKNFLGVLGHFFKWRGSGRAYDFDKCTTMEFLYMEDSSSAVGAVYFANNLLNYASEKPKAVDIHLHDNVAVYQFELSDSLCDKFLNRSEYIKSKTVATEVERQFYGAPFYPTTWSMQ